MHVETFSYDRAKGWSIALPSATDAENASADTLVLAFGASDFIDDGSSSSGSPLQALVRAYPNAKVIGCSTAGEINGTHIVDGTLSVAVARFDRTHLHIARASVAEQASSRAAGETIARELAAVAPNLRAVLVLSDGLSVNGTELLHGFNAVLPPSVVITGGLAADGTRFKRTWVLAGNGNPSQHMVVAVGLYGDAVRVTHGSRGGWDIFGPERRVTRSVGSVLYEVDGSPALSLYKTYLGERATGLPATALLFPLGLRESATDQKTLVRTILAVDEDAQSMTFAGDIPQGAMVQLMRANFDHLIDGAAEAGRLAKPADSDGGGESLTIAISCVGRRLVLGERTEEEVEATQAELPSSSKLVGFYSYGEISPVGVGECGALHNQTMTVTSLSEG